MILEQTSCSERVPVPTLFVRLPKGRNDAERDGCEGGPITNLSSTFLLFALQRLIWDLLLMFHHAPRHNPPTLFCRPRSRPTKRREGWLGRRRISPSLGTSSRIQMADPGLDEKHEHSNANFRESRVKYKLLNPHGSLQQERSGINATFQLNQREMFWTTMTSP